VVLFFSRSGKLSIDMNAAAFRLYVDEELGAEYPKFVCNELAFNIPMSFALIYTIDDLRTHISRCVDKISEQSKSYFFYSDNRTKLEITPTTLGSIEKLRKDILRVMTRKKRKIGTLS
jgi:hypothetical protein